MSTAPLPHGEATRDAESKHAASRGFSLVELLVTIILAGIVFAAMVPFFANALKRSSGDDLRNTAANIAQDRIEQVRLLSYNSITQANLTAPPTPFGDNRFGPNYTVYGSNRSYHIDYTVVDDSTITPTPSAMAAKLVTVTVTRPGLTYTTTASTLIKSSDPGGTSSTSTPTPAATITGLSITVSFKNYTQVTSSGVTVQRVQTNVTPNVTFTPTPLKQVPNAASTTVTWTGLTGGTAYMYTVTCHSTYIDATSPQFHLLKSARLKFDTHPGGS
jgi:prepilin-type N-terminal cleavage/methylation domain-containing protein